MNIADQIENLKTNNLIIEDEEDASRVLNEVSYYRLIKAYGKYFTNKNGRYNDGTSFERVWRVYEFDDELRQLIIPYIQRIEITLRCRISNYFCVRYGVLGYKTRENFEEGKFDELDEKIDLCFIQAKDSPIMKNFKNNYEDGLPPFYAAVELFSFGVLVRFFNSMRLEDRKAIADMYVNVNEYYLGSWLKSISYVRNLCMHYNRLYSRTLVDSPKLYKRQDGDVDSKTLFSVFCCMRYLYSEYGDWRSFVGALADLLDDYKDCVKPSKLGFINNWEAKLLDQELIIFK